MTTRIRDGHPTYIEFVSTPGLKIWEITVTPPGLDGGGENDTTTMRNVLWRTRQPKHLITLTEFSFVAAYDPAVYPQLLSALNVNQKFRVYFPDGDTYEFWGWLNEFKPNEVSEGAQPDANCTIIPSNQNNSFVETAPVHTLAASTTTTTTTT